MLSTNAEGLPDVAARPMSAFLNRPDHLTRAASELARWHETVALASTAVLNPAMPVRQMEAAGPAHTALLTDARQGAAVANAIKALVEQLRLSR
jgi:hypothetical protein